MQSKDNSENSSVKLSTSVEGVDVGFQGKLDEVPKRFYYGTNRFDTEKLFESLPLK